eukprot:SAG31_NODE_8289_length_1480_cov_1.268646_1_plen_178_part_00
MFDDDDTVSAQAGSCELSKHLSTAPCKFADTFGCNANGTMWTSHGCRGMFSCNGVEHVIADNMGSGVHMYKCISGKVPNNRPPSDEKAQVWLRPTADGGVAVVLHNPAEKGAKITVDFSKAPKRSWTTATSLDVRDLWAHENIGPATGKYTSPSIPSHGSMFLKLTPHKTHMISSDQ